MSENAVVAEEFIEFTAEMAQVDLCLAKEEKRFTLNKCFLPIKWKAEQWKLNQSM